MFDIIPGSVATLLAALVAGLFLLYVHRLNAFRTASIYFCAAFAPELAAIQSPVDHKVGVTYDTLKNAFTRHHEAVATFRIVVPWYRRSAFDKAWETYHRHQGFDPKTLGFPEPEKLSFLTEYLAINPDEEQRARKLAIQRIDNLLSFARHA